MRNVILMGKKKGAAQALEYLLRKKINVKFVVAMQDEPLKVNLASAAKNNRIPILDEDEVYRLIAKGDNLVKNIDLVLSFLFWNKIKKPLIDLPKIGCINLHPAPLPDYKSRAGYNTAILDGMAQFGVTAHFIDSEKFDDGPIIKVLKFPIDKEKENVISLERKTQDKLFILFKQTIDLLLSENKIPTTANKGGLYLTKEQLEDLKIINISKDTLETIHRKIRAFFFPPYTGAKIKIKGEDFTLVDKELLEYLSKLIHRRKQGVY